MWKSNIASRALLLTGSLAAVLLGACASNRPQNLGGFAADSPTIRQIMRMDDQLIAVSPNDPTAAKPILILVHGATKDPTEMLFISEACKDSYESYLFSFDFHRPLEKVARDLIAELTQNREHWGRSREIAFVVYSYSAIVFREAVLLADDPALFRETSLIQIVPTAGGSALARPMRIPLLAWAVARASEAGRAENPYGPLSEHLWGCESQRIFSSAIDSNRVCSLILEKDAHSFANATNVRLRQHFLNGAGPRFEVIPKSSGLKHGYFPTQPAALPYVKKYLDVGTREGSGAAGSGPAH